MNWRRISKLKPPKQGSMHPSVRAMEKTPVSMKYSSLFSETHTWPLITRLKPPKQDSSHPSVTMQKKNTCIYEIAYSLKDTSDHS
jgi:hypothetical protein